MRATSAGICLWRRVDETLQVLIVHPGGPYWANKDAGAWSFPKGEYDPAQEDGIVAARREFAEELGSPVADELAVALGETKLKSGKVVRVWAVAGDLDADAIVSNTFEMQWPPRSGNMQSFPEVDRARWCDLPTAHELVNPAQTIFLDRLQHHLES